jgi:SAM-dependent methyltransferase
MPAEQGVVYWPREGPNISALVERDALPLPDNSIDRVIVLHAMEGVTEPAPMLREIWRVMKSGGRCLTIIPNRRGLWAHSDRTPFGNGLPYSPYQIKTTLHQEGFSVENMRYVLYVPPFASRLLLSQADRIEKVASRLFHGFGGLLLVEAGKQLYAPMPVKAGFRHRFVLPLTLPTPATPLPT